MNLPGEIDIPELAEASELVALANDSGAERLVVAKGQFSPFPEKCARALVYRMHEDRAVLLADRWVSPATFATLARSTEIEAPRLVGECDSLFKIGPKYLWCAGAGEFLVLEHNRIKARAAEGRLDIGMIFKDRKRLAMSDIESVRCFLTSRWFRRGVGVIASDGSEYIIVRAREHKPGDDPAAGPLLGLAESRWLALLARELGSALSAGVEMDKDFGY